MTGTGLGLWISQESVNRHRGSFRVRTSTAAGKGGTGLSLFLPYDAVVR
jgi:signal transduction histidine kinase